MSVIGSVATVAEQAFVPYAERVLELMKIFMVLTNDKDLCSRARATDRVDVFFSIYPYAKLLALLFATMLLIGFGGLVLHVVSNGSLAEAFWLSWTFIADSGNHLDSVGVGPRVVSVSISSGGMLIFCNDAWAHF
ncbi:hypothetical protein IFM89_030245 [Coptis chinensis]|uniref:Uncharacterized protein n=1 Tax=Coptis chinensis TaxID=261450 RepID=A0A835HYW7_9MAGN|nr:hypothetical protein IFM89_030245 [Coptis chinensis]